MLINWVILVFICVPTYCVMMWVIWGVPMWLCLVNMCVLGKWQLIRSSLPCLDFWVVLCLLWSGVDNIYIVLVSRLYLCLWNRDWFKKGMICLVIWVPVLWLVWPTIYGLNVAVNIYYFRNKKEGGSCQGIGSWLSLEVRLYVRACVTTWARVSRARAPGHVPCTCLT